MAVLSTTSGRLECAPARLIGSPNRLTYVSGLFSPHLEDIKALDKAAYSTPPPGLFLIEGGINGTAIEHVPENPVHGGVRPSVWLNDARLDAYTLTLYP